MKIKLTVLSIILFLTGCTNHNLLIRCQQLEGQRDEARQAVVQLMKANNTLQDKVIRCMREYEKVKPKQVGGM